MPSKHKDQHESRDADLAANAESPQMLAAYRVGRALNHIQWLARLAVLDARPMSRLAKIESILDVLVPLVLEGLPASGIHAATSRIEDARREWRDFLQSESFSEQISDSHHEFHNGDDAAFDLLLGRAEAPWRRLHAIVLDALQDSSRLLLAVQLGVTVDQRIHTPGVVDGLLDRIIGENVVEPSRAARQRLGGTRAKKLGKSFRSLRASSIENLPAPHGWSQSVQCLADRLEIPLGVSLPVDDPVDETAAASVAQTQAVDTAIAAYLAPDTLSKELPPPDDELLSEVVFKRG